MTQQDDDGGQSQNSELFYFRKMTKNKSRKNKKESLEQSTSQADFWTRFQKFQFQWIISDKDFIGLGHKCVWCQWYWIWDRSVFEQSTVYLKILLNERDRFRKFSELPVYRPGSTGGGTCNIFSGWSLSSDRADSLGVRLVFMKEGQHHRNKSADWSELSRIHYPRRVLTPTERYVESFTIESHQ